MSLDWTFINNKDLTEEMFNAAVKRGLTAIGLTAESYAKRKINQADAIETGRLINSVTYATDEQQGTFNYKDNQGKAYSYEIGLAETDSVYIGTSVEYAPYIEFGHHSYPAVHYLKDAAANHSEEYKRLMEESLKNA